MVKVGLFHSLVIAAVLTLAPIAQAGQDNPVALARQGWEAIKAGRAAEAAALFERALKRAPDEPSLLVGAATAAHLEGRSEAARTFLLNALTQDPKFIPASLMLGELLYRNGDVPGAVAAYENAQRYAPGNEVIARKLDEWRKEADLHDRFDKRFGQHFTILFEGPAEAPLAARAVEILESAYWRIGGALYGYPADVVTVVLYTREQFRDITQSPAWAGGAFDGRIRVPVQGALQNPADFERVLTHELTHAFVHGIAPRQVPQWLNEGLAMYFDGTSMPAKRAQLKEATPPALARLEGSFDGLDGTAARLAYARSATAVDRLVELAGPTALGALLGDLGAGVPLARAFERHVGMSYEEFQQSLVNPL